MRGGRAVPASGRARRRAGAVAGAKPLPVHPPASRALRRPHPGGAARHHRRGGRLALLGRAGGAVLRHELSGRGPVQRDPRAPVHRRPDAQASHLYGYAERDRARRDRPAAPDRPGGDADAGERGVRVRELCGHLRWRPDDDGADRPGPLGEPRAGRGRGGVESLVATGRLEAFRCAYGHVRPVDDRIVLSTRCARALGVGEDAPVLHVPRL